MCFLNEASLSALIRAFPAFNGVFVRYRSEVHTAATLNTLRARDLDLQLREPMYRMEVSLTIPKPHSEYVELCMMKAIADYQP